MATFTSVQSNNAVSVGSVTSLTITLGAGVTQGNMLVACFGGGNSGFTTTPPDASWQQAGPTASVSGGAFAQVWYLIVDAGHAGGTSWAFTLSVSHSAAATIREWNSSTGWPANPVDASQGSAAGSTTTIATGTTGATTQASELAVAALAWHWNSGDAESGLTAGYTSGQGAITGTIANISMREAYQALTSTGTQACQETVTNATFTAGVLATFIPAAAGGAPAPASLAIPPGRQSPMAFPFYQAPPPVPPAMLPVQVALTRAQVPYHPAARQPGFTRAPVIRAPVPQFTAAVRTAPRPQPRRQAFAPPPVVRVVPPSWTRAARAPAPAVPRQRPQAIGLAPKAIAFPVLARRGPPQRQGTRAGFSRVIIIPVPPPAVPPVFPVLTARRRPLVSHPRAQYTGPVTPGAARPAPPAWLGQWTRAVRRHRTIVAPAQGFIAAPRAVTVAAAPVIALFTRALRILPRRVPAARPAQPPAVQAITPQRVTAARTAPRLPRAPGFSQAPRIAAITPQRVAAARVAPRPSLARGFSPPPRIGVITPQLVQARHPAARPPQARGFPRAVQPPAAPVILAAWTRAVRALRAVIRRSQATGPLTRGFTPPPPPWPGTRTQAARSRAVTRVPVQQGFAGATAGNAPAVPPFSGTVTLAPGYAGTITAAASYGGAIQPSLPYSGSVASQAGYGGTVSAGSQYGGSVS